MTGVLTKVGNVDREKLGKPRSHTLPGAFLGDSAGPVNLGHGSQPPALLGEQSMGKALL